MKLPGFEYARPATVDEALDLLADPSCESRILAGGQSLLAAMNFRLSSPQRLIDINRLPGLSDISVDGGLVRIGALVRHAQVAASPVVGRELPLLARAVREVAHPAIRNRGTFGGSLALADPAAEMPAVALACRATLVARSAHGERRIDADDFFLGLYETALRADELLVGAEIRAHGARARDWAFAEQARRRGDYASAGVAVRYHDDPADPVSVVLFGVSDRPVRARAAEAELAAVPADAGLSAAARRVCEGIDVHADLHNGEPMKRHLCGVLLRRALDAAPVGAVA